MPMSIDPLFSSRILLPREAGAAALPQIICADADSASLACRVLRPPARSCPARAAATHGRRHRRRRLWHWVSQIGVSGG